MALAGLTLVLSGCVDGGPHPEPPDLGPPASGGDAGIIVNEPDNEGSADAGVSGAGGAGGTGGASGPSDSADADACIDGGRNDEDAGPLR